MPLRQRKKTGHSKVSALSFVALAVVIAALALPRDLLAQITPNAPNAAPATSLEGGNGLKLGSGRLHLSVSLDTHFVVNPGQLPSTYEIRDNNGNVIGTENPSNDLMIAIGSGLQYEIPSDKLQLDFETSFKYLYYFGLGGANTKQLSTPIGDLKLNIHFNKRGDVGFRFREHYVRSAENANQTEARRLLHNTNTVGLGFDYKPGAGAMTFSSDYSLLYDRYDRDLGGVPNNPAILDNLRHQPELRLHWRFLPKTAGFIQVQGELTQFTSQSANNTHILRSYAGLIGNITPRLILQFKAGYGDTFTGTADNYRTGIGVAELGFKATSTSKYKIGYIRTVTPTSLYKFMGVNRAFIRWDQMAFGRVTLSTQLDGTLLTYGNAVATADDLGEPIMTTSGRMDFNINFKTVLSVEINQNFSVSLSETFTTKISNGETSVGNVGYTSNDIFLRLSGRY